MKRDPDSPADPPTDDNPDTDEWIPDEFREGGD